MKKLIVGMLLSFIVVNGSVWAGQCDCDPNYDYSNGHRIVPLGMKLPSYIIQNIKVCVDNNVPNLWKNGVQQAVLKLSYNLSSVDTELNYSNNTNDCTVHVSYTNDFSNGTYAEVRGGNEAGVYINSDFEISSFTDVQMKLIMMHELLHFAGFMHTGRLIYDEVPNTDNYWVTKYIAPSIMCATTIDSFPSLEFNALDKVAIETLFPL